METFRLYGINYYVVNLSKDSYSYNQIADLLKTNNVMIRFDNTKVLNEDILRRLDRLPNAGRLKIRIVGGYDDYKISKYPGKTAYREDNIYTPRELIKIVKELQKIEKGMNPNWDDFQKVMYFVNYLRERMIYHPFHEIAPSKDIRSLLGLCSGKTVCAGYSLILKELCDRNGIECQYVTGSVTEEDYNNGITTHAWNIVKINGVYVPLDLTWNAGKRRRAQLDSIDDLFNVNEFIKHHIPGRFEQIQDYRRELRSIEGKFVRTTNAVVNRDMQYESNRSFVSERKDGSKFSIVSTGSFIQEGKMVYRYIYRKINPDGTRGIPVILYSTVNVTGFVSSKQVVEKIQWQIREARKAGDMNRARELENSITPEDLRLIEDGDYLVDNVLFSKKNIEEAYRRGDCFLGGLDKEYDSKGNKSLNGVSVDVDFGKSIGLRQKTCKRSDGTYFIIEDYGKLKFSNAKTINRYRIYETLKIDNQSVVYKNTVFSDEDLINDNRQQLYDDFLARDRLDRKVKEAGGYLGYYSDKGIRTYDPVFNKYFRDDLCRGLRLDSSKFKEFYENITIDEIKRIVNTYKKEKINGRDVYINRVSNREVTDSYLLPRIQFAYIWVNAAGLKHTPGEIEYGLEYATNEQAKELFDDISKKIRISMNRNGNVDPIMILMDVKNEAKFEKGPMTVVRMFDSEESARLINSIYRLQNPSALPEKGKIEYFYGGRMYIAESKINERRNLEAKRRVLQVVQNQLGQIELVPKRSTK